jgi:hypothetical protein
MQRSFGNVRVSKGCFRAVAVITIIEDKMTGYSAVFLRLVLGCQDTLPLRDGTYSQGVFHCDGICVCVLPIIEEEVLSLRFKTSPFPS